MNLEGLEKEYQELVQKVIEDHEKNNKEYEIQLIQGILELVKKNPSVFAEMLKMFTGALTSNPQTVKEKETKDETSDVTIRILHLHKFI